MYCYTIIVYNIAEKAVNYLLLQVFLPSTVTCHYCFNTSQFITYVKPSFKYKINHAASANCNKI